jgi:hypothetical protein
MTMNVLEIEQSAGRRIRGALRAFSEWGGYPIIYITQCGEVLCAACATVITDYTPYLEDDPIVAVDVFYEGADEHCAECNAVVEPAYGNPYED